jgi:hypothetical protein
MSSSDFRRATDDLQVALRPLMSEHGFRTRGRTFHRKTADALTQVVHLQMGSFDPPGTTYVAGLRHNLYGAVTVNLGVYVPETAPLLLGMIPKAIQEFHCCLRSRLGELGPEKRDTWWELRDVRRLHAEISRRLIAVGLPWLDGLSTRDAILATLNGLIEIPWAASSPPRIVSAIILAERGEKERARTLLRAQALEHTRNPGHPLYVRELAEKLHLELWDA